MSSVILDQRYEVVPTKTISTHPRNARRGDLEAIEASIATNGFYGSVVVHEQTRQIMVGNHRFRAAVARGLLQIPAIFVTCSGIEAERIAVADNRVGDLGTYDNAALLEQLERIAGETGSVAGTGYSDDDFAALEAELAALGKTGGVDDDSDDAGGASSDDDDIDNLRVPSEPITKKGDLWLLGEHRLLCGDSFNASDRKRLLQGQPVDLVLMDPPFAIYGSSTGIGADIADDKMIQPFFEQLLRFTHAVVREFAHVYVCCDWRSWATIWGAAKTAGLSPKNCIVWDKASAGLGSNYANTYELVGFFARLPPPTAMKSTTRRGQRTVFAPNIARYNRVTGAEREHNAAKPAALFEWLIGNSSDPGESVADFFIGSGTTIVAAERAKRKAFGMEMEPRWCDVSVARWERLTNRRAKRVPVEEQPQSKAPPAPDPAEGNVAAES